MNFLSKLGGSGSTDKPAVEPHERSASDVLSSAKLVAEAAKSCIGGEGDKGKLAGASADLLGTASDYGKLDESKGVGKYVDQAEKYLNEYEIKYSHKPDEPKPAEPKAGEPAGEKEDGGSGFGGYMKMAEGFIKNK